ncbi:MAG TPA: DUF1926 domain-containing protein [Treponema sp.]|nr:DUF1926 domain-containing protein [Treponema sp.]
MSIKLCLGTACSISPGLDCSKYEEQYQELYKPLLSNLYNLVELPFTLFMSGPFLEWIEHKHPEFFMLIEEMIARTQLEVLGGGYYTPYFPMISPSDRVGQTELLTTSIRKQFGKRPRGAWLPASAWDPSLISSFCTCGIEYLLMDKVMLETSGFPGVNGLSPVTLEDSGKTVIALPLDNRYKTLERYSPKSFLDALQSSDIDRDEITVIVFFDQTSIPGLFTATEGSSSWIERFLSSISRSNIPIELTSPGKLLKTRIPNHKAYISTGMSPYDYEEIPAPEDIRILARTSVKQHLINSNNIMRLYSKMMYVTILVNQVRGDKARKKTAREEVWRSQYCETFRLLNGIESPESRVLRTLAYKNLLMAEKSTRIRGVFSPSIVCTDFDMDSIKEYLCQLDKVNMYVHTYGGKIFELDVFSVYRNFCDTSIPSSGLFIDHFFSMNALKRLSRGILPDEPDVFSCSIYQEQSIDRNKCEIQLKTNGTFGSLQQPLSLRKQYLFRNEGIQVQYILKNDSPLKLTGVFVTELDFSLINGKKNKQPEIVVYSEDIRKESGVIQAGFDDVSWIQLLDPCSNCTMTIEANENPSVSVFPIILESKTLGSKEKTQKIDGVRVFLYWKVDLSSNYETEKTVFLKLSC